MKITCGINGLIITITRMSLIFTQKRHPQTSKPGSHYSWARPPLSRPSGWTFHPSPCSGPQLSRSPSSLLWASALSLVPLLAQASALSMSSRLKIQLLLTLNYCLTMPVSCTTSISSWAITLLGMHPSTSSCAIIIRNMKSLKYIYIQNLSLTFLSR